jgi:teichuronic acid biosynthesis glycosyltransferase TuaC
MLRVLTLATLFPDKTRPQFGPFVEMQTRGLAAHPDVELIVVAPVGLLPFGSLYPRYRSLATLPDVEEWKGLTVHRPRFRHLPRALALLDAGAIAKTVDPIARAFQPDVIDAQFFWPDGVAAVMLGKALNIPVSIKARGADIHYWGNAAGIGKRVVEAGCSADGLLSVSQALKYDMVALGMPARRITVHRTGIDRNLFRARDREMAKAAMGITGPLLVSVGNLIARKGHHHVIAALQDIPGADLVIIGGGGELDDLKLLAKQCGVGNRVRFTGSLPHAVIANWLAAADAMVLMSASEGLANAWIEALASGTPIVISKAGGAREVVSIPEAGRIALAEPADIAEKVTDVLAANYPRDAVAACVSNFSWEANSATLFTHLSALKEAATKPGV